MTTFIQAIQPLQVPGTAAVVAVTVTASPYTCLGRLRIRIHGRGSRGGGRVAAAAAAAAESAVAAAAGKNSDVFERFRTFLTVFGLFWPFSGVLGRFRTFLDVLVTL